jgi:hypothetical protein
MLVLVCLVSILILPFKSKCRLEAENIALRHQVMVLRRQVRGRVHLTNLDRLFLVQLYHWFPSIRRVLAIVQPETVVRWAFINPTSTSNSIAACSISARMLLLCGACAAALISAGNATGVQTIGELAYMM